MIASLWAIKQFMYKLPNEMTKTVEMHIHCILKEFFSAHYLMNKLKIRGKC